jgi:rubredoxin
MLAEFRELGLESQSRISTESVELVAKNLFLEFVRLCPDCDFERSLVLVESHLATLFPVIAFNFAKHGFVCRVASVAESVFYDLFRVVSF